MRFAARTEWSTEETAWSRALARRRQQGLPLLDLTASNPTECGFDYSADMLAPLAEPTALHYEPDPRGMRRAREAVCSYYRDHDAGLSPEQIFLTTSTSEGYGWLFRLLCDPGDEVLIAQPSYPLFDLLAAVEDVRLAPYPLLYDPAGAHGWSLDLHALEACLKEKTRALVVVHPNNPTGHYTTAAERAALAALCRERGLALIVDEVFLDYPSRADVAQRARSFASGQQPALTFVLSGLSKVAALPQMKASWIACLGPEPERTEAMRRLEIIADTFLSMNAPIQHALPVWLAGRAAMQQQLQARTTANQRTLDAALAAQHAMVRLDCEGGWYATLRTPPFEDGEAFAVRLLQEAGVAVHPGSFFGFCERNRLVLSLLPREAEFARGIAALLATASR
jgi:alanine-synthesizing transaminase